MERVLAKTRKKREGEEDGWRERKGERIVLEMEKFEARGWRRRSLEKQIEKKKEKKKKEKLVI